MWKIKLNWKKTQPIIGINSQKYWKKAIKIVSQKECNGFFLNMHSKSNVMSVSSLMCNTIFKG
jgi:hypothetical protein